MADKDDRADDTTFYAAVGTRIRELRRAAGMTQETFGAVAGMNEGFVWRVEKGRQNLSLKTIGRIALVLDVPITAIFDGISVDASVMEPRKGTAAAAEPEAGAPAKRPQRAQGSK